MAISAVAFSSCATKQQKLNKKWEEAKAALNLKPSVSELYEWRGDDLTGPVSIEIELDDQMAYFKIGGNDAGWSYVATGIEKHRTPTGRFRVTEKKEEKYSNLYGAVLDAEGNIIHAGARIGRETIPDGGTFDGASMPYWMRLTNWGVGLHAGPIPHPGHTASHGCIRLPEPLAEKLFAVVKVGTPVVIRGQSPD